MTPPDPLGPVTIGAREIYDELKTVGGKVDQLGSKVDGVVAAHEDIRADLADHETRLRALERGRWPLPAVAALLALGSLITAIITAINGGG